MLQGRTHVCPVPEPHFSGTSIAYFQQTDLIFLSRISTMSLAIASDQVFNEKSINPILSIS